MTKMIIRKAIIILIGMIKSGIVGAVVATVTASGNFETIPAALLFMLFLLPAMFLYHLGKAINLKNRTCDILYFVGVVSVESFAIYGSFTPDQEGGDNMCRWILYTLLFSGAAVYLAEVIFRDQKYLKGSSYQSPLTGRNWDDIFGQIFKQPKTIFLSTIRSYIIAAIVMSLAGAGPYFVDLHIDDLKFVVYGLLFSLCLLPAIILYHFAAIKFKRYICDIVYFITIIAIELCFLPFISKKNIQPISDIEYNAIVGMGSIGLGGIFVYLAEVYFRNRAILKNLERK